MMTPQKPILLRDVKDLLQAFKYVCQQLHRPASLRYRQGRGTFVAEMGVYKVEDEDPNKCMEQFIRNMVLRNPHTFSEINIDEWNVFKCFPCGFMISRMGKQACQPCNVSINVPFAFTYGSHKT